MGKLIKYELRKQRTSRMVIFIALAITLIGFWAGLLFKNESLMAVCIAVMIAGAFLVLFYTGIESILVLNRDLRTKQSYMLWMLPKSVWQILGAKFISAILQMLIVFGISGIAVGISRTCRSCQDGAAAIRSVCKRRSALDGSGIFCICYFPELDTGDHDGIPVGYPGQNAFAQVEICRRPCSNLLLCH